MENEKSEFLKLWENKFVKFLTFSMGQSLSKESASKVSNMDSGSYFRKIREKI
jgi:hypothetical protein